MVLRKKAAGFNMRDSNRQPSEKGAAMRVNAGRGLFLSKENTI
jgi:hypothetical protein